MRVVPERPDLLRAKAVDVALARQDGVLSDARDAVLGVRHVHPVPVDGHALGDVAIHERHLDEVALAHAQLRSGDLPSKVSASTGRPEARRIVARRAVSVNAASGAPVRGPCRSATEVPPAAAW